MTLRIALAQINMTVGDIAGNRQKILDGFETARDVGADLVVFPEMAITGYPPEDLLLKPDFVDAAMRSLEQVAQASRGLTAIVGTVYADDDLYNAAAVLHDGRVAAVCKKQYLPNYGVFDENRYFQAGQRTQVFLRDGIVFGVGVCEDIWYPDGPPERQASLGGAELIVNISASPYSAGKVPHRERMLATRAAENTTFVAYCNMVGGQDELVFDGHSLIFGPQGELIARGKQFEEDFLVAELDARQVFRCRLQDPRRRKTRNLTASEVDRVALLPVAAPSRNGGIAPSVSARLDDLAEVYNALVLGTRDYVRKNGFRDAVLGLSGGVDSAFTAAIAADALGSAHVTGVALPTRYSSPGSIADAELLAGNLGIHIMTIPIDDIFQAFLNALAPAFNGRTADLAEENLQPRIRGTILMALSNKLGSMVLTTGNKSETSVGYSTLYGDTAGGFAVIKDVPKMLVYALCEYRNRLAGRDIIPQSVLDKPPSAELRPDQKDSDSLPEYSVLDPILHAYIEESRSVADIAGQGFDNTMVRKVIALVDRSEYKRRQSPPGVRVTSRAFGKDWRLPISNRFGNTGGKRP